LDRSHVRTSAIIIEIPTLQNDTLLLLLVGGRFQCGNDRLVEDVLKAPLSQGGALDVPERRGVSMQQNPPIRNLLLDRVEILGKAFTLLGSDGLLTLFRQLLNDGRVVAQIDLGAHDEAGYTRTVVPNLGKPLLLHDDRSSTQSPTNG